MLEEFLNNDENTRSAFAFTADHEEPSCGECDFYDSCAGKNCGPEYGWRLYRRTINFNDMTQAERLMYKINQIKLCKN